MWPCWLSSGRCGFRGVLIFQNVSNYLFCCVTYFQKIFFKRKELLAYELMGCPGLSLMSPWLVTLAANVMHSSTSVETYFTGWVGSAAGEGRGGFLLLKRFRWKILLTAFVTSSI